MGPITFNMTKFKSKVETNITLVIGKRRKVMPVSFF